MTDTPPQAPAPAVRPLSWPDVAARLIPDTRVAVMLGVFGLAYKILLMIEAKPALLDNSAFMTVVTLIIGGSGLGAVIAFLFGGTRTGAEVMKAQSASLIANSAAGSGQ